MLYWVFERINLNLEKIFSVCSHVTFASQNFTVRHVGGGPGAATTMNSSVIYCVKRKYANVLLDDRLFK